MSVKPPFKQNKAHAYISHCNTPAQHTYAARILQTRDEIHLILILRNDTRGGIDISQSQRQWTRLLLNAWFDKMSYVSSTVERALCMLR